MRIVTIEPISEEAFTPFGQLLPAPEIGTARMELIDELQNLRGSAKPRLSLAAVHPKQLPLTAIEMERHIFSSQAFIPFDCDSYLVLVAPHAVDDMPEESALRAFSVPGSVGINYAANVWHHPLTALNSTARFVVLTFVDGSEDDEQFVKLSQPVAISF